MDEFIEYTTAENERWDTVSFNCYGDATLFNKIIEANPGVPISNLLPAGTFLKIPVLDDTAVPLPITKTPPWKQ